MLVSMKYVLVGITCVSEYDMCVGEHSMCW